MMFGWLEKSKDGGNGNGNGVKNVANPAPLEEGVGAKINRNTHILGVAEKRQGFAASADKEFLERNGFKGMSFGPNSKEVIPAGAEGAMSPKAVVASEHERIYLFHWPTMVYIGFDHKDNEKAYLNKALILYEKPEMVAGFGNKKVISAPSKDQVQVV